MRDATVVVCSTRAAAGVYPDRTGPVLQEWLTSHGWRVELVVVADGPPVGVALAAAVAGGARLVVTSGGTGPSPTDATPEQTAPLLARALPGIAEELRRRGAASTPHALLSRGLAGITTEGAVVVNLPGSSGGVRDGIAVLDEVLEHLFAQLDGEDHR